MPLHVREAIDRPAREAVFRFRYQMQSHVTNMGLLINHKDEKIEDAADEAARIFYIEEDGDILGAIRINFCHDAQWPATFMSYTELDRIETVMSSERISVTSHLYVRSDVRKQNVLAPLFAAIYSACLQQNVLINFWHCLWGNTEPFQRLGYRPIDEESDDQSTCLALCVQDVDYLRHIESPLFWLAGKRDGDGGETAFYLAGLYTSFLQETQACLNRRVYEIRKARKTALDEASRLTQRCVYA